MKMHYSPDSKDARPLCERRPSPFYSRSEVSSNLQKVTCEHCKATIRNQVFPTWYMRGRGR